MMSVVQKGMTKAGIELQGDMPPAQQRSGKWWQRAIAALRAAEAAEADVRSKAERQLNESLQENLRLQEENHALKNELLRLKLKSELEGIEALTVGDRSRLLGLSHSGNGGK